MLPCIKTFPVKVEGYIANECLPSAKFLSWLPYKEFVVKIFGAFITLKVSEPLSGKTYLDSKFNFKNELVIPKSENFKILNIWDVYQRTQDALFSKLSKQISLKDDKLKEITKTKNIEKQLTDFEEVIKKCK